MFLSAVPLLVSLALCFKIEREREDLSVEKLLVFSRSFFFLPFLERRCDRSFSFCRN